MNSYYLWIYENIGEVNIIGLREQEDLVVIGYSSHKFSNVVVICPRCTDMVCWLAMLLLVTRVVDVVRIWIASLLPII